MNQQNVSSYNKLLVEYITSFLCFLLKFREQNKLTANILGEIFASAIMHSNDVVSKKYMSGLIMKQCRNKSMYSDNVWLLKMSSDCLLEHLPVNFIQILQTKRFL